MDRADHELVQTGELPWEPDPGIPGFLRKLLNTDPASGAQTQIWFIPPGWGIDNLDGKPMRHYHRTVTERSLQLHGDFPHWEYSGPNQRVGDCVVKRKGFFMDRPPRCVHGLERGPSSQTGVMTIYWSTGGGTGVGSGGDENVAVPFKGDLEAFGNDYTQVRFVDTAAMRWAPHPAVAGWKHKELAPASTTREAVSLIFIPPGWRPDELPLRGPPGTARRWLYTVSGDTTLSIFAGTAPKAETVNLREGSYLAIPAGSAMGWSGSPESEIGVILLCVGHEILV